MSVQNQTVIDQSWLLANRNDKGTLFQRWLGYTANATGALREIQLFKGVSTLYNQIAAAPSPVAERVIETASPAIAALGMVRIPAATQDAFASLSNLHADDGGSSQRKVAVAVKDSADACSAWGNFLSFLFNTPSIRNVTQFFDVANDGCDLGLSVSSYGEAAKLEQTTEGEVKKVCEHSKKYYMLRVVKAIVSLVAGILAIGMFVLGGLVVPALAMTALSLASTCIAIHRDLHKDGGEYPILSFDRPVRV